MLKWFGLFWDIHIASLNTSRYYLKGPKAGKSELLLDNLPGYPDNIKLNSRGNFYVGLASVRYEGSGVTKPFLDVVAPFPAVKRFVAKVNVRSHSAWK